MVTFADPPLDDRKQRAALLAAVERMLRPAQKMDVAEWAEAHREMPRGSPIAGKWRHRNAPPLEHIMRSLSPDDPAKKVVFKKSSGVGGSACGENWVGFNMDRLQLPMLVVFPSDDIAERWVIDRFRPLISNCRTLKEKFQRLKFVSQADGGRRFRAANSLKILEYDGGRGKLYLASGASDAQVASIHLPFVYVPEVDKIKRNLANQGSGLGQIEQRAIKYPRGKIFIESTPTNAGSSTIDEEYAASDQRVFRVPCRYCGVLQTMEWGNVSWPKGGDGEHLTEHAYYLCAHCDAQWSEADRRWSIRRCDWVAKAPYRGTVGWFLWSAYDLFMPLADLAKAWVDSYRDSAKRRQFVNQKLGQAYKPETREPPGIATFLRRREPYEVTELPEGVVWINFGLDLQDDRAEVEIVGWGPGERSWSLDYRVYLGDPGQDEFYSCIDELLALRFTTPGGARMKIACGAVNTAGHHAVQAAYRACRVRYDRKVYAVIGRGGDLPTIVSAPSVKNVEKVKLYPASVDVIKDQVYSWLAVEKSADGVAPPGFCAFPLRPGARLAGGREAYGREYFEGLTAEHRVEGDDGVSRWVKKRARNEPLDCRVYAVAAKEIAAIDAQRLKQLADMLRRRESTSGAPAGGTGRPRIRTISPGVRR